MESVDLAIIGAEDEQIAYLVIGAYGLAVAKTYLEVNPSANVVVLDSASSVGGVFAQERLYPGLNMNNLYGTYEYSDFAMDGKAFGVEHGQHISGVTAHRYLRAYAKEFGIYSKIRFDTKVEVIEKCDDGWIITTLKTDVRSSPSPERVRTSKIVIATGACSEPFIPDFKGAETFDAPIFHNKYLGSQQEAIKSAKSVVVLAGSKSGFDAAYMAASYGVQVDWVLRASGNGPIWIAPPYVTPFKKWLEKLVNIRFLTWFSPCTWGDADGFGGIRRFLHGTAIGRWFVDRFWSVMGNDVLGLNKYDKHPETKKLKPWSDAFWAATSFSILNYPTDFFDYVRDGTIRVHISDISHLSHRTVHLESGETICTDALICSTGWKPVPTMKFLPEGTDLKLGIPHRSIECDNLAAKADEEILSRFPRLRVRPVLRNTYSEKMIRQLVDDPDGRDTDFHPFRLYRFLVPPAFIRDRSICFAGMLSNFSNLMCAQTQALWITDYLSGKLRFDTASPTFTKDVEWEAILHSQLAKWRYPFGSRYAPDFVFDCLPYIDSLLGDLGVRVHRKRSRLAEWFEPYGQADYRGLVDEWKEIQREREG